MANCVQVFNKRLVLLNPKYVFRKVVDQDADRLSLPTGVPDQKGE